MNFAVNNQEKFQTNSAVHSVNTRSKYHVCRSIARLLCFQKSVALKYSAANHVDSKFD